MDHIKTHVARSHLTENRVEIRAIVIQEPAGIVHDTRHLRDATLEHAECGRISEHDASGLRADCCLQSLQVHIAILTTGNLAHLAATHRGRSRIGAVRRLRDDDFIALEISARTVVSHDHGDTCQLALSAGHRSQRDRLHSRHFLEHLLQLVHAGEKSLAQGFRRKRMMSQELRQHRQAVARPGVVFHRA